MNFGQALYELKCKRPVRRKAWAGIYAILKLQVPDENSKMTMPYIYVEVAEPNMISDSRGPWNPTHTDLLAEDWEECGGIQKY
jgi:hypothetical protein